MMVIFLFLRSFTATIIPAIAVPLSIVGTFGIMYLLGYSLNNLISDGAHHLDRLRRRRRHRHDREHRPLPRDGRLAARRRAQRLRANRLHDSLADRLAHRRADPVALHGRYRGPALPRIRRHARRHHPGLRRRLAHAHADDGRAPAQAQARIRAERLLSQERRVVRVGDRAVRRGVQWVLRHQTFTLIVTAATLVLTLGSTSSCPRASSPSQDTGVILAITEAQPERLIRRHGRAPAAACARPPGRS